MTSRPDAEHGGPGTPGDGPGDGPDDGPRPPRRLALLVAIAAGVLAVDLATKSVIVASMQDGERIPLLGDFVALQLVRNPGAAFSLATGMTWVLTLVAVVVVSAIAHYARRLRSSGWAVALGLVLGGALGNLTDRFFRDPGPLRGHVVDFVAVGWWPVFNVADSSICVGGAVLVVLALLGREIDGTLETDRELPPRIQRTAGGLDLDDERVVRALKTPWPANKWDSGPAAEGADRPADEEIVDEDDRPPRERPRHPANKWERG